MTGQAAEEINGIDLDDLVNRLCSARSFAQAIEAAVLGWSQIGAGRAAGPIQQLLLTHQDSIDGIRYDLERYMGRRDVEATS